jgi:uncharacterized repeat protein (TIGR01451 family)
MDYTITPVPPRSLVRRIASWTAALGLLSGGGYGVYHYAVERNAAAVTDQTATADAPSSESASDRLLAARPTSGSAQPYRSGLTAPASSATERYGSDRYAAAPALPPAPDDEEVTTPRSAAAVEAPTNPFSTTPVSAFNERYTPPPAAETPAPPSETTTASLATPPTVEEVKEPAPAEAAADAAVEPVAPAVSDVARGQEPGSVNPLRSGTRSTEPAVGATDVPSDEATEARAAFGAQASSPAPTLPPNLTARPQASTTTIDPRYAASSTAVIDAVEPPASSAAIVEPPIAEPTTAAAPLPIAASGAGGFDAGSRFNAGVTPTPGLATADGTGRPGERILEGLQAPTITIQKLAPPEIQVGKKATFAVRVQNNSQRTAHNVQVVDEVPLGTQLVGTAPKANVSGAQVVWDLGTLGGGEERIVEMELMPTEEGEIGSVATVTFAAQASAKTRSTRPQLALRLSSNPRVMIGEQQLVTIEVTNPGSGDATGVMLLESIPQGVSHEAGPALEFEVGTLRAGETKKLELVLQADEAGLIDNIMTARADANLQVQANCQFEVIAPELKVTVEGPSKRYLERPATYTVSVDNPGTASAREVQLVTQLPKGLQFVSANNMGEYDAATHSVYWSLAELPANQRGTVELTALPVESGEQTLQFATRAAQGLEDRTETQVTVEGIVAMSFEVQGVQGAIEVGGETAYEIRVVNQGSKAATNVQIVAQMPAGLRAQAGQGDARYQVQGDRVVFAPLPSLAPKADATFTFRAQGLRAGDQRVSLQLTTDEVREPIVEVESTQVYSDE